MRQTKISWTQSRDEEGRVVKGATWNPIRGCTKVSEGCRACYAMHVAARFSGPGQPYEGLAVMESGGARWTNTVRVIPEHLYDPLRWRKPRRIFVNSMSDLFHEGLDDREIDRIFAVMALARQHVFQVLTKRARRMRDYFAAEDLYDRWLAAASAIRNETRKAWYAGISDPAIRFPNWIWLGVSVEDQKSAEERVPLLLETPSDIRWVSAEPLLGPIDFRNLLRGPAYLDALCGDVKSRVDGVFYAAAPGSIDWIVVGGESGHHMPRSPERWMKHEWARDIRDQCRATGTAYYFKQSSGTRSETGTALEHEDGSLQEWRQYPGALTPPTCVGQSPYLGAFDRPGERR